MADHKELKGLDRKEGSRAELVGMMLEVDPSKGAGSHLKEDRS